MTIFSVLIPVYQNEPNLPTLFERMILLRQRLDNFVLDLVLVNDGSTDGSKELLDRFYSENPYWVKIVHLSRNFGQTPAIQVGLQHVAGECVGIISADLQENPDHFFEMLQKWNEGCKLVIGERALREEGRWHRLKSQIYWRMVRSFALPDFPRSGYDFCVIDRQLVDLVIESREKNTSIFVLLYWFGFRATNVPIVRNSRRLGKSQWNVRKKILFTFDTLIGFTYVPARFISFLGFGFAALFLFYLFGILFQWFYFGSAPAGWMTVVTLICLSSSAILVAVGILAEYLLRILDQARMRPFAIVDQLLLSEISRTAGTDQKKS